MTSDESMEKRKDPRVPLSKKDAVYCIVIRAKSAGTTLALSTMDFSESGFQFAVIPTMKDDFFVGETLYLKAIIGTRNLTFKDPIELSVIWQTYDAEVDIVRVGCEVIRIATEAEKQFMAFVEGEVKFKGVRVSNYSRKQKDADISSSAPSVQRKCENLRITSLFGGFSETDNTAILLSRVENELEALGHHIERMNLFEKKINGCGRCRECQENIHEPGCVQQDGATQIIKVMMKSDLILYASPVDFTGFSLPMKALMERCFSLYRGVVGSPSHQSFVEGRYQALIATTAGSMISDGTSALSTFHELGRRQKTHLAGEFFVCHCHETSFLDMDDSAKQFAQKILDRSDRPYAFLIPGEMDS